MVINTSHAKRKRLVSALCRQPATCVTLVFLPLHQVMETERMIYLVTEYASGGEIFGKYIYCIL